MSDYANYYYEAEGRWPLGMRLRGALRHGMLSFLGGIARPTVRPALRLLYCHHVFDDERKNFAALIENLVRVGEFVSTQDVLDIVHGRKKLSRHAFHLSFDDGFKNILANALPVLRDWGVKPLMFVATSIIDNPGAFPHLEKLYPPGAKKVEHASWSDLEDAAKRGLEIGSHTRSHAYLSRISGSPARLEDEIAGSKEELSRRFGACDYFSWPYGGRGDVDEATLDVVKSAGYQASFGAFRGAVAPGRTNPFRIPRHHFEPYWPLRHVKYFAFGGAEA